MDGEPQRTESERSEGMAARGAAGAPASVDRLVETAYRRHGAYLYRHLVFVLGEKDEAWDVLQQVFFRFLEFLRQGKSCERTRPFLTRTATRLAIAHARSWLWRRRPLDVLPEEALRGDELPAELVEGIRRAHHRLAPKARAVLEAMLVERMSYTEMRDSLGFSASTVKRAIRSIIKELKKYGVDIEKFLAPNRGLDASI